MKYKELIQHAEMCQLAADEMAFTLTNTINELSILSRFQSHCDFNLFWIYSIAPEVVLHISSVEFLLSNKDKFKRKITIKELLTYDYLINWKNPETFNEFKNLL